MSKLVDINNPIINALEAKAVNIIKPQAQSDQERLLTNSLYFLAEDIQNGLNARGKKAEQAKQLAEAIQANPTKFAIYLKNLITLGVDISQRQAYFLPYGNEITSVLDYKTLMALIKKHTNVKSIDAQLVYENETFKVEQGKVVEHKQDPFANENEKGSFIGAYSVFTLDDGSKDYYFASVDEINQVKECSKSANSEYSPWKTWPNEMRKKTVIRKGMKFYPMILDNEQRQALDSVDNDVDFNLNKQPARQHVEITDVKDVQIPGQAELRAYCKDNNLSAAKVNAKLNVRARVAKDTNEYFTVLSELKEMAADGSILELEND